MRYLLRRLGFYAIALWGAITLNFLLPRLAPGSPIDGLMSRMPPVAARRRTRTWSRTSAPTSTSSSSRCRRPTSGYLKQLVTGDFGVSTSNFPAPVSDVIGRTLPYSIFLVGTAFAARLPARHGDRDGRRLAPRRDRRQRPDADVHVARRVPRLLQLAPRRLLPRPQARLVPDPARVRPRARAGLQLGLPLERVPARPAADPDHRPRLRGRLAARACAT